MRAGAAADVEFTPVFDWRPPRRRKISLISFVVASLALHALCFYLFQIIYPPTVALLPPPARVTLVSGNSEEGRVLLRWIEAEDPALSSTTQRPPGVDALKPPTAEHVPSYANHQPVLREPPPLQPDLRIPTAQPPGPVPTTPAQQPSPPPPSATVITFDNAETLGAATVPRLHFAASGTEPPQAARFRIAVNSTGEVRYCFLDRSSGDAALDQQAHAQLVQCRFTPTAAGTSDSQLLWTAATIEWGNDLALPPSSVPSANPKP